MIWMDDTYVHNIFLCVNYGMGRGTMLFPKWFKACTIKSSAWINSIAFFTENRNRTAWYRILWSTTHFEAKAACISATRAADRFMSWVVLRTEQWNVLILQNCSAYVCCELDSPILPNSYVIHCKTLVSFFFFVLQWYHFICSPACQISEMILVMSVILPQKYLEVLQFHKTTNMWGVYSIYVKRRFIFWCLGQSER